MLINLTNTHNMKTVKTWVKIIEIQVNKTCTWFLDKSIIEPEASFKNNYDGKVTVTLKNHHEHL